MTGRTLARHRIADAGTEKLTLLIGSRLGPCEVRLGRDGASGTGIPGRHAG